ncbi:hypothetical protein GCM10011360_26740 [Primorskyibacter flagellatus]|uniref:N-acetyltransferase domain-containing protein n=1 Tax=Primorskyibacter flagellatus TaxID=1387277 RepID=A0A917EFS3_9RHOB|nr:GNAT family N-acetyltransferase [Primorskyibacter flagellatus]GGE37598.1 hypothetical protein GCM10011360_26740 [Primorskyibacter flagellatus]
MTEVFRQAEERDAAAIAALWHSGWIDGHGHFAPPSLWAVRTEESFLLRTNRHLSQFRVVTGGDRLLGFHLCKGDEVNQFYLAPEARGSGLAGRLMTDAETQQRAAGHSLIWLACGIGNDRARRFYEKAGWRMAGTRQVEAETAEDPVTLEIWRMEKDLVP